MNDLFGPESNVAVIEVGCSPSNKRFQARYNSNALVKTLSWGGYEPEHIYTAVSHWTGSGNINSEIDIWIKHLDIAPDTFDKLDDIIISLENKQDKYISSYLDKIQTGKDELDPQKVRRMITQEGRNQKYSNVRGILAEYISRKMIETDLGDYGVLMDVTIGAPTMNFNNKVSFEMDACRQLDLLVVCPDHAEFSKFLGNLKKDKYLEIKINPLSAGLY